MTDSTLSDADIEILKCLQRDARAPVSRIAKAIDLPESTVRHRLNRMLDSGVLEFIPWINPTKIDAKVWVIIELQVDLRHIERIAQALSEFDQIYVVGITTGPCDIHCTAVFQSHDDLLEFMTGPLSQIQGIRHISTSTIIRMVKRAAALTMPLHPGANGRRNA